MMEKHLVVVPHTHWDREWYMPFESFRKRLVAMMDHMIETLEDDPAFKYFELDGQTIVLEDYLAIRPEREKRLRKLIEKGRILIGPWYVLPDELLVTGESIIRNLRLGIKTAKRFGKPSMIGYMPDMFGHVSQIPQILTGLGIRSALVWRGVGETVDRTQFLWEAPDGTQLFTIYLADSYSNGAQMPLRPAELKKRLLDVIGRQEPFCDIDSLLVMNGSDHLMAQAGLPARLEKAARGLKGVTIEMGNFGIFIRQAREQADSLSVHRGEFRSTNRAPLLPGVTSARVRQKQRDFRNCRMLEKYVEPLCAWAALCGDGRPHHGFIEYAWRLTLRNHPHDSICGCSVDAVHEQMEGRFERVEQVTGALMGDALSFLSNRIDSSWVDADSHAICVYNPTSTRRQIVDVVADVEEPDFVSSLRDGEGRPIPLQKSVGERELFFGTHLTRQEVLDQVAGMRGRQLMGLYINNMLWQREGAVLKLVLIMGRSPMGEADVDKRRKDLSDALADPSIEMVDVKGISAARTRLTFFADGLAPVGLSLYSLSGEEAGADEKRLKVSEHQLENDFYSVSVNINGSLNILDKESGAEFRGCLHLVDDGDRGDSYNYDEVVGGEVIEVGAGASRVSVVEDGPVRATLKLEACLGIPKGLTPERDARAPERVATSVTTLVSLYRDIKRIDFRTTLDNQCEDHRLRIAFTAPFKASEVFVESAFDVARRPTRPEAGEGHAERPVGTSPQKTFSLIQDGAAGMALFNRGIPEVEAFAGKDGTEMLLTLIRCVGWLSREDLVYRPNAAGPTVAAPGAQSKGAHEFEYAFTSYGGDYVEAGIVGQAHAYAFPAAAIMTDSHKGKIKNGSSLVEADNPNIAVSAVEGSKTEGAYFVRLYNTTDRPQEAGLSFWSAKARVYEVNLLGRKRSKEPLKRKGGRVSLDFRPSEIKTLHVAPPR